MRRSQLDSFRSVEVLKVAISVGGRQRTLGGMSGGMKQPRRATNAISARTDLFIPTTHPSYFTITWDIQNLKKKIVLTSVHCATILRCMKNFLLTTLGIGMVYGQAPTHYYSRHSKHYVIVPVFPRGQQSCCLRGFNWQYLELIARRTFGCKCPCFQWEIFKFILAPEQS